MQFLKNFSKIEFILMALNAWNQFVHNHETDDLSTADWNKRQRRATVVEFKRQVGFGYVHAAHSEANWLNAP